MVRSLLALAAVAPSAIAINSRLYVSESDAIEQGMEFAVQARQYAMLYSQEGRTEETGPKPSKLLAHSAARRLGESASLSEAGYSSVAGLQSQEAMQAFAEKLVEEDGLKVKDAGMLKRIMPYYSGECAKQSMKALRTELHEATAPHGCHAAWVEKKAGSKEHHSLLSKKPAATVHPQHGDKAPLNEPGYQAVAALKSDDEMKTFIRRASKAEGIEIMNEGGLSGFARYYSGVCATQSFAAMTKELRAVQHHLHTTSVSYDLPAGEAFDEHKVKERIAAATGLKASQIVITAGTSSLPDAAQLKKLVASKSGVEEDRVTVMKAAKKKVHSETAHKHEAKKASAKAAHATSPKGVKSFVVTVTTDADDASVEDALKNLPGKTSMKLKVNSAPVTMAASVAQPQKCGGGWLALEEAAETRPHIR